jgi:monolysocardiolipin acyltransferase
MTSGTVQEDVYTVPSADPLNANSDPRAKLPWIYPSENIRIPTPRSFFHNLMSLVAMTGATTLGRMVMFFHRVEVHNIGTYRDLVAKRSENRSLITVSNHQATLDDPLLYSILTSKIGTKWPTSQRWTVGASELCFANGLVGLFCNLCKVLPVVRGIGIWQPFMDDVVARLSAPSDNWVHLFPEGRVHQDPKGALLRFKWGVGRLVVDPPITPLVLPIHIEGTKLLLDEKRPTRSWLSSWYGSTVTIRIGDPIDFTQLVEEAKRDALANSNGTIDRVKTYKAITQLIQEKVEELRDQSVL